MVILRENCEMHCDDHEKNLYVLYGRISGKEEKGKILFSLDITRWPEKLEGSSFLSIGNGAIVIQKSNGKTKDLDLKAIIFTY